MLNSVIMTGRMVADPELRTTQSDIKVTSFRIAVTRNYKVNDEYLSDFFTVVAWRNTAEFVSRYFTKGRMMLVEGRLQMRDYTDRDGNRRVAAEVVTDNVFFCDSPRRDGQPSGGAPYGAPQGGYDPYGAAPAAPAGGSGNYAPPANFGAPDSGGFAELSDNDGELPF